MVLLLFIIIIILNYNIRANLIILDFKIVKRIWHLKNEKQVKD